MKRFSITQLLLFVTWCGIAFFLLARYLAKPPYQGGFHDIQGTVRYHYGLRGFSRTKFDETAVRESPTWDPADANPPLSAARALAIADRFRRQRGCNALCPIRSSPTARPTVTMPARPRRPLVRRTDRQSKHCEGTHDAEAAI